MKPVFTNKNNNFKINNKTMNQSKISQGNICYILTIMIFSI